MTSVLAPSGRGLVGTALLLSVGAASARAEIGDPPIETTLPQTLEQQITLSQAVGVLTLVTLAEAMGIIAEVVATHGLVASFGSGITTAAAVGSRRAGSG